MARLFISHSSKDNVSALAFQTWLAENGWAKADVFVDLHSIGVGERWRDTLRKANAACEAVVLLASPESLSSIECQKELELAEALGKEVIVALLRDLDKDDPRLARYSERQFVDLSAEPRERLPPLEHEGRIHRVEFNQEALAKIKARLEELGIAPASFAWPPKDRPSAEPFPGLTAFGEDDAGIFFGREVDIMAAMTEIRLVRRRRQPRLIVVQAASGAGKSSFLRAGLWPRLKRDPDFAPLAILRPAQGIISGPDGIAQRIAPFFERHGVLKTPGSVQAALLRSDPKSGAKALADLLLEATSLATATRRAAVPEARSPAPLLAIDQAEELFSSENATESSWFLNVLSPLLKAPPSEVDPYILLTIRSDSVQSLLDRVATLGLDTPKPIYLPPLARESYREVIVRPAEVYSMRVRRLGIDPALVHAVVEDAKGADALPLIAFTLGQLYANYGQSGELVKTNYEELGGVAGSIRRALASAQARVGQAGSDDALRRLIIPQLATWDPTADQGKGAAKRVVARLSNILDRDRMVLAPLANALVEQRLLTRGADTLEVAHEALLRQPPIEGWLAEDRDFLMWRDRLAFARTQYASNERGLLVGRELQVARDWLAARPAEDISTEDREFVTLSIAEDDRRRGEEEERERQRQAAELELARQRERAAEQAAASSRRLARRTTVGIVASIGLTALAAWQWSLARREAALAEDQSKQAAIATEKAKAGEALALRGQSLYLSSIAHQQHEKGNLVASMLRAVEALPDEQSGVSRPLVREAEEALLRSYFQLVTQRSLTGHAATITSLAVLPVGDRALTTSEDGTAKLWDLTRELPVMQLAGHAGLIKALAVSKDGRWAVTGSSDATARLWDLSSGETVHVLAGHAGAVSAVAVTTAGKRVITVSPDNIARVWNGETGAEIATVDLPLPNDGLGMSSGTFTIYLTDDDQTAIVLKDRQNARLVSLETGKIATPPNEKYGQVAAWHQATSHALACENTSYGDTRFYVLDMKQGTTLATLADEIPADTNAAFSPDGRWIATWGLSSYSSQQLAVYDAVDGHRVAIMAGGTGLSPIAFSADSKTIYGFNDDDKTIDAWQAETGTRTGRVKTGDGIDRLVAAPQGGLLAYAGTSGQIRVIHDFKHDTEVKTASNNDKGFVFEPKTGIAVSNDELGRTVAWDTRSMRPLGILNDGDGDGEPRSITISPDGTLVADARDHIRLFRLNPVTKIGETNAATSVLAFSPDSRLLLAGKATSDTVLTALSGQEMRIDSGTHSIGEGVAETDHAGRYFFSASVSTNEGNLWDLETGHHIATIPMPREIASATFDRTGQSLAIVTQDRWNEPGHVRIVTAKSGSELASFETNGSTPIVNAGTGLIFLRKTAGTTETVLAVDLTTGVPKQAIPLPEKAGEVSLSSDGRWLAVNVAGAIRIFDAQSAREVSKVDLGLKVGAENDPPPNVSIMFSGDGRRILTNAEHKLITWTTDTGQRVGNPIDLTEVSDVEDANFALNQDGSLITASIAYGSSLALFDTATGARKTAPDGISRWWSAGTARYILNRKSRLEIWDARFDHVVGELIPAEENWSWRMSPDEKTIVAASEKQIVAVDQASGRKKLALEGNFEKILWSFAPDSQTLAVLSPDGSGKLIDLGKSALAGHFDGLVDTSFIQALPGGRVLSVRNGSELSLIDTGTLGIKGSISLSQRGGRVAAFTPDGQRLVTAGLGTTASIWSVDPLTRLFTLDGHTSTIQSVAFDRDGQKLVTGGDDGRVIIWNASTGEKMRELKLDQTQITSATFETKEPIVTIKTSEYNAPAIRWNSETGEQIKAESEKVAREFTSPDGKRIASFSGAEVKIIDAATKATVASIPIHLGGLIEEQSSFSGFSGGSSAFDTVSLTEDGRTAISTSAGLAWPMLWTSQEFVEFAKTTLPRCLTQQERKSLYLDDSPPAWCIELAKWPYNTPAWRKWLDDKRAGNVTPLPPG